MPHDVFLSYSRQNTELMQKICSDLRIAGFTVWTDENIDRGMWQKIIEQAIDDTKCMVVILSPSAKNSEWVNGEINYARAKKKVIFPLLLDGDDGTSVPLSLISTHYFNIRDNYKIEIGKLISAIGRQLNNSGIEHPKLITNDVDNSQASADSPPTLTEFSSLEPWNPFDQLRLLYFLLWKPERLQLYRGARWKAVEKTAIWIISAMSWIPLFAPLIGYTIGTVRVPGKEGGFNLYLVIGGVICLTGWFVTPFIVKRNTELMGIILLIFTAFLSFSAHLFISGATGIAFTAGGGVTAIAALIVTCISIGTAAGIALRLGNANLGIPGGITIAFLVFIILFHTQLGLQLSAQLGVQGGLAGAISGAVALGVAIAIEENLRHIRRTRLSGVLAIIISVNFIVMIGLYVLGGWFLLGG